MGQGESINKIVKYEKISLIASISLFVGFYLAAAFVSGYVGSIEGYSFAGYILIAFGFVIPILLFILSLLLSIINFLKNNLRIIELSIHYITFITSALFVVFLMLGAINIGLIDNRLLFVRTPLIPFIPIIALILIILPIVSIIYGKRLVKSHPEWTKQYHLNAVFCILFLITALFIIFGSNMMGP